jgi:hypothetical protein
VVEANLTYQSVEQVEWTLYESIWLGTSGLSRENHTTQEGGLVIWTDTSGETLVGMLKLDKDIEKSCSDPSAHPGSV